MGKRARRVRLASPLVCSSSNYEREGQVFHVKHSAAPCDSPIARAGRPTRVRCRKGRPIRPLSRARTPHGARASRDRAALRRAGRAPRALAPLRCACAWLRPRVPPPASRLVRSLAPRVRRPPCPASPPRSAPRAPATPAPCPACASRSLPRPRLPPGIAPAPGQGPASPPRTRVQHRASVWPRPRPRPRPAPRLIRPLASRSPAAASSVAPAPCPACASRSLPWLFAVAGTYSQSV